MSGATKLLATWCVALACACGTGGDTGANGRVEGGGATAAPVDSASLELARIEERILADPGNALLYLERGNHWAARDSMRKALADVDRALRIDSNNAQVRIKAGDLRYVVRDVVTARRHFERAIVLAPTDPQPLLRLAEMDLIQRRYKEGMDHVNDALRIDATVAKGYYLKGWMHQESGDTALAISSFRTAVEQDPQDYNAYVKLGLLSAARHDPLAEQYYNTAIELRPTSIEAIYNKAVFLQDHGRDSAALACYERMKAIDANNAIAWYNSGWVRLEHLGDFAGAKRDFSKAIELETNYADAWYNRGVAMERTNELDSAAANYQLCLSIAPAHTLAAESLDRLAKKGVRIKMRERKK